MTFRRCDHGVYALPPLRHLRRLSCDDRVFLRKNCDWHVGDCRRARHWKTKTSHTVVLTHSRTHISLLMLTGRSPSLAMNLAQSLHQRHEHGIAPQTLNLTQNGFVQLPQHSFSVLKCPQLGHRLNKILHIYSNPISTHTSSAVYYLFQVNVRRFLSKNV